MSREEVIEDAEQTLILANSRVVGPGLSSTSPERSKSKENMKDCRFGFVRILLCLRTIEIPIDEGMWSRQRQTDDGGIGQ